MIGKLRAAINLKKLLYLADADKVAREVEDKF